jgi:hypothetical protein
MTDHNNHTAGIRSFLENHSPCISVIGILLILVSSILLAVFPTNILVLILWILSIVVAIIGVIFFIESRLTRNFWSAAYWGVIVISILEGIIFLEHLIELKDIQTILNAYITIEIAILSVVFAAVAIKDNILQGSSIETIQFKEYVFLLGFFLLGTIIFYCVSFVNTTKFPFSSVTIGPFSIYTIDVLFFVITILLNVIIMTMVFYIAKIIRLNVSPSH